MRLVRDESGVTLVELLVAFAVSAFVMAAGVLAFRSGTQIVRASAEQVQAQQGARASIDRMIQEIRGAGYDPTANPPTYNFDAITAQSATAVTLQSDFNGDGAAVSNACDWQTTERVRYQLSGTDLLRSGNPNNVGCNETIVSGIQALTFTYLAEDGTVTATAAQIRTVVVSVTVSAGGSGNPRRVTLVSRARLRNR